MSIMKYDLDINKQAIIKPVVILRQGDHDIDTMQVSLSVANEPMDLTGATVTFMGNTANGRQIIDDAHVKIIDAKGGVFEYVFPSEASSDIGEYKVAYFSIILGNGQSSTMDFRVQVLSGVDISAPVASEYITHYDTMVTALNSAYDSATHETNEKMASTVSSLATSAATVLDSALARVNTVDSKANQATSAASKAVSMASSVASAVTSQASYINSVASSAVSNVSSAASNAVNKLNNIKVGGRNLFLNSRLLNIKARENIAKVEEVPYDANTNMWHITAPAGSTANVGIYFAQSSNTSEVVKSGQQWAFSFDIKGTGVYSDKHVGVEASNPFNSPTGNVPSSWTRVSATGISAGSNNIIVYFNATTVAIDVYIKMPKLEIGNVATDWTPAPEDAPSNDSQLVHKTGGTMTGSLTVGGNPVTGGTGTYIGREGSIELGAATAFIDFHGGNSTSDFTSRMYDSGDGLGNKIVDKSGFKVISTPFLASSTNKYNLDTVSLGSLVLTGYSHKAIVSVRTDLLGTSPYTQNGDGTTNVLDNVVITWERGYNEKYGTQTITNLWESLNWQRVMRNGVWQPWFKFSNDSEVLHKTGNETVAGDKTFTGTTSVNTLNVSGATTFYTKSINWSTGIMQGNWTLQRIGNWVMAKFDMSADTGAGTTTLALPIGFRPLSAFVRDLEEGNAGVSKNGTIFISKSYVGSNGMTFMFPTNDTWPV